MRKWIQLSTKQSKPLTSLTFALFSFSVVLASNEVESFICSDEFVEKSFEEFVRCDTRGVDRLTTQQLLLACLHLEQDLRPLLPLQSVKHRQPILPDAEFIMKQFVPNGSEMEPEQFIEFARALFRNVCAHVKA